jgi:hypothetical protein
MSGGNGTWRTVSRLRRLAASTETEWPILFHSRVFGMVANLRTTMQIPCRIFHSAWQCDPLLICA